MRATRASPDFSTCRHNAATRGKEKRGEQQLSQFVSMSRITLPRYTRCLFSQCLSTDIETLSLGAAALSSVHELSAQLCQLGLEQTQMVLGCFVLLCSRHLVLDILDLFQDAHG